MLTVLVVEDELIEREALKKILTEEFITIQLLEAKTGREAINHIQQNASLDLILLDIKIPAPNGVEVLQFLRDQKNSQTKVIVTTANDDFDTAKMMITLKADDYLLKPIRPKVLLAAIYRLLNIEPMQNSGEEGFMQCCSLIDNDHYHELCDFFRASLMAKNHNKQAVLALLVKIVMHYPILKKTQDHWTSQMVTFITYQQCDVFYKHISALLQEMYATIQEHASIKRSPLNRALYYIENHLFQPLSLDEVAEHCHVSSSYLSRLFSHELGANFVTYVAGRKMQVACFLLNTTKHSIQHIAFELSFQDPNYFGRVFKKKMGTTPSDYRKQAEK